MERSCLFCLESLPKEPLQNPIGCSCHINAHLRCLHQWFQQRQTMECPICHTVAIPNRMMHEAVHIVYVSRAHQEERHERFTIQQKGAAFCCFMIMGWSLGLTVLELVYR